MEVKALTGTPYLTLDDMKRKNSQEQIFIDFFNAHQMSDRESTSRAVLVSTCYERSPLLFNYYAALRAPKTLIIQNYVLSGHPTIKVQIPTKDAIRQSASDLGLASHLPGSLKVLTGVLIVCTQPQKSTFPLLIIPVLWNRVRSSTIFRPFTCVTSILMLQSLNNTIPMRKI